MSGTRPILVCIAGGSASGKTTLAALLKAALSPLVATVVTEDAYYHSAEARGAPHEGFNFDDPKAKDFALLGSHLQAALRGEAFDLPTYDFATHDRLAAVTRIAPCDVLILEGLHNLGDAALRRLAAVTVFVEAATSVRRARRIARDVRERGREAGDTARQFDQVVEPMHARFVEPQAMLAAHVIANADEGLSALSVAARHLADVIRARLNGVSA